MNSLHIDTWLDTLGYFCISLFFDRKRHLLPSFVGCRGSCRFFAKKFFGEVIDSILIPNMQRYFVIPVLFCYIVFSHIQPVQSQTPCLLGTRLRSQISMNWALKHAARTGDKKSTAFLLEKTKQPHFPSMYIFDDHIVQEAVRKGHLEVVQLLMDSTRVSPGYHHVLFHAVLFDQPKIFEWVYRQYHVQHDEYIDHLLNYAALFGREEIAQLLLTSPLVNVKANDQAALFTAVKHSHYTILESLLAHPDTDPTVHDNLLLYLLMDDWSLLNNRHFQLPSDPVHRKKIEEIQKIILKNEAALTLVLQRSDNSFWRGIATLNIAKPYRADILKWLGTFLQKEPLGDEFLLKIALEKAQMTLIQLTDVHIALGQRGPLDATVHENIIETKPVSSLQSAHVPHDSIIQQIIEQEAHQMDSVPDQQRKPNNPEPTIGQVYGEIEEILNDDQ